MNLIWWQIVLVIIGSYFIGNLSFARYISRALHSDITTKGSGNPGSTNMLRNYGFKYGILTLALDMLKGVVPTLITWLLFKNVFIMYIAGISVILGHIYPVLYKFKGGKGIATMLGVFMVADPVITPIVVAIAAVCWMCFEYGSVASFTCVTALTVVEGLKAKANFPIEISRWICLELFFIFCITWYAHRANIQRLLIGKESKVSLFKKTKKSFKQNAK